METMETMVRIEVSYNQLAVFASALSQPFNEWTEKHVAQGFTWRPGSVSFRTLSEAGPHFVDLKVVDHLEDLHPDTVRALEVPFEAPDDGMIEIGSIAETVPVTLPKGLYLLRCEFLSPTDDHEERVRLTFVKNDKPQFSVVRADPDIKITGELLTTAEPAPC